ncbi:MAG: ApeA N-terminal domain 1-containing protein [Thiobacillus sp.]
MHPITESVEFSGDWSLSGAEDARKIAGTLSWSSQRASLELHDAFTPLQGAFYGDEVRSYPAVFGTTISSQYVTVLEASGVPKGINFGPAGIKQHERVVSSLVIVGAHVSSDTLYSEIRVRIPGLQIWIGRSGIRQTLISKTEDSPAGMIYQIDGLPEEMVEVPNLPATLGWGVDKNFSGDLVSEISVKSSACLRIQPRQPQSLDWYFDQVGKATTLLAFMAGSPMSPDHITGKVEGSGNAVEVLVALRDAKYCEHKNGSDFYMLRNDMGADLGTVFMKWFQLYDTFAAPSQLALSVLNSKDLWLHVEFLTLMQALEGFHRATMPGLYTTEPEYETIRKTLSNAIPNTVSPDHKDALKARIKYGNEISLRKRLDALVKRLPIVLRQYILGDDGLVPKRWVDTRNYYTHWDEASRESVLDGIGMHRAGVRMKHLLRALYLDLVGIPHSAIIKSLGNACGESQYLIQLNGIAHRKKNPGSQAGAIMHISVSNAENSDESAS